MRACSQSANRFILLAIMAPLLAACTTTGGSSVKPAGNAVQAPAPVKSTMPRFPKFIRSDVDPALSGPCVIAAANKYYLPEKVIHAVNTRPGNGGNTDVILAVDVRSAVCSVSANGNVRSVVDTTPRSADQVAADEAARKRDAAASAKKKAKVSQ